MASQYTVEDWSLNPTVKRTLTLRQTLEECPAIEDDEIHLVTKLGLHETVTFAEFSVTRTA